jgi:hypothetical protein
VAFADDPAEPPDGGGATDDHCYVIITTNYHECFATFAELTAAISGGRLVLQSPSQLTKATAAQLSQSSASLRQRRGMSDAPLPATVLGVVYADLQYSGPTQLFFGPSGDCGPGASYRWDRMPSGWNDRVSSFASWGKCDITLYENENAGGRQFGPAEKASLGSEYLNNRASSIGFVNSGRSAI